MTQQMAEALAARGHVWGARNRDIIRGIHKQFSKTIGFHAASPEYLAHVDAKPRRCIGRGCYLTARAPER
jgi:hypothetical protein